MSRIAALVALLALLALAPAAAADEPAVPDIFQASAESGGVHDSIAVPAYFETFFPYSLSEASNGSAHSYNAVFYGGFFLTAAAEQFGFPPPPGTTETLYPQGPTEASAEAIPNEAGAFGETSGRSSVNGASGKATAGGGEMPGMGRIGFGETTSLVVADANKVASRATVVMNDVMIADVLRIGSIAGEATAVATGVAGGATASGQLVLSDVTIAGVPVELPTPEGLGGLEPVLAPAGITITRLPDVRTVSPDGTRARLQVGGVTISFNRPEREFTLTLTFGRLDVSARAEKLPALAPAGPRVSGFTEEFFESLSSGGAIAPSLAAAPSLPPVSGDLRAIRRVVVPFGADFSALAAVIALAALGALFSRRILQALID